MKFSKKTAHRLIIALSMFAPVLYLFGTMFFYLAGAHDGLMIGAGSERPTSSVSVQASDCFYPYTRSETIGSSPDLIAGGGFSASLLYNLAPASYSIEFDTSSTLRCYFYVDDVLASYYLATTSPYGFTLTENTTFAFVKYNMGAPVVINSSPDSPLDLYNSSADNTEFLFGQMFPENNFLVRVGVNALSSEPIGFAPFGAFLSYLDENMLHASESQMALMIYGEVYWALHIVLADLVYHVAVFFPNLIERVFDWFGQKGLNDD